MKEPFNALQEGVRAYAVPLGIAIVLILFAVFLDQTWALWLGFLFLLAGGYVLFFFRDPDRHVPIEPRIAVSSADGVVVGIEDLNETPYYEGPCKRVSVFLSLLDVHVNRAPLQCVVRDIQHRPGQFLDARLPESSEMNESNTLYLDSDFGPVTVRQIAGLVARRIVCKCEIGDQLQTGERFGMIKFGSRTELYLPLDAKVAVRLGDRVKAGQSVLARFR